MPVVVQEGSTKIALGDLRRVFHLPIQEAAKELNVGQTVLKRICRKHAIKRWPYRSLTGIKKMLDDVSKTILES